MTFDWKKTIFIVLDTLIAVYLVLACSTFNKPAEQATVCSEVKITIEDEVTDGFLHANEIKNILQQQRLYPLSKPMDEINARDIEEYLRKSPFVERAECHKTQSGHVCISIRQRMPILQVMAHNGDNYYVDTHGSILPKTRYSSDLIVATGHISRKYAQQSLAPIANVIISDKFWNNQIEQLNILSDGSVEAVPRVGDHIIYLGAPVHITKKLERLRKFYQYGLNEAGWNKYSYINVEFDNQIICKKARK